MISRSELISKCLETGRSATPQRMSIIDELCSSKKIYLLMTLRTPLKTKAIHLILVQYIGF